MELATLLTAFAALLTSFVTMFTVREMRRQRVISHLPIIKLLSSHVKGNVGKNQHWLWDNESLQIINFGKGVALDVKVEWEVPIDEIITMLKKYDPHNVKETSLDGNLLKLESSVHFIKIQSENFFPAITEHTESINNIIIPSYLTTLFGQYINEALINRPKSIIDKPINIEEFPTTNIKINYVDINDNKYEKSFSLSILISSVSEDTEVNLAFNIEENFCSKLPKSVDKNLFSLLHQFLP